MIPNKFHFIYGFAPDFGGKPFGLVHYLAMKSAIVENNPDEVFFYYMYEPETEWFKKIKPYLSLVKINAPETVFGNPLCHVAHQADLVRLLVLYEFGGIYMDLDTICNKPFAPLLNGNPTVMGLELLANGEYGLCNAVILAEKNAPFIEKWLDTYQLFRSPGRAQYWDEHSVKIPRQLADFLKEDITVEGHKSFHYPTYTPECIKEMFVEKHTFEEAYCHHLWESLAWDYLGELTEETIWEKETSYHLLARRYLEAELPSAETNKSDFNEIAAAIQQAVDTFAKPTPLSYLNQHYYDSDRKLINEYLEVRPITRRIPFLRNVVALIKKMTNRK